MMHSLEHLPKSLRLSHDGQKKISQLVSEKGWKKQDPNWYTEARTSLATLKRFLRMEWIDSDVFVKLCEVAGTDWRTVVDSKAVDDRFHTVAELPAHSESIEEERLNSWDNAPDFGSFYGRSEELNDLSQRLKKEDRLILIWGEAGIGKTGLAVSTANQIRADYDCLIWQSLQAEPPPSLDKLLTRLLDQFTHIHLPPALDDKLLRLMYCLKKQRTLIVIDGFEKLLSSEIFGGYRDGYKSYKELLKQIGQGQHKSCLLLTSRNSTIPEVEGWVEVFKLKLEGLDETTAKNILRDKGLTGEEGWSNLICIYRGNPLLLKLVAQIVKNIFKADVLDFLRNSRTFLTSETIPLVAKQFNHLPLSERKVLRLLAQEQDPVSIARIQDFLQAENAILILDALFQRSLIEITNNTSYTLTPIIREYVIDFLLKDNPQWGEEESGK
jgi:hypothetical protein